LNLKSSIESDQMASSRKEDHIDLAFKAKTESINADPRFDYEPLLSGHTKDKLDLSSKFAGRSLSYPIWVSSMTGGTEKAKLINHNLARVCGEYGLGMGLGSCRQLLFEDKRLSEFAVREYMPDSPLFINLGIAQIEHLLKGGETSRISELTNKLQADGLIIHINPLQEWLQPEGDVISKPPIDSIKELLNEANFPIIIKEVGQGFGPASLKALLSLPIAAIELAGYGGTNFAKLELMRSAECPDQPFAQLQHIGHTCEEMISNINQINSEEKQTDPPLIIISGGIRDFLDGYYFMQKCALPAIYAQASGFLKHAQNMDELRAYVQKQIEGLKLSHSLLKVKV